MVIGDVFPSKNYTNSLTYNTLLLHEVLIQYFMIVIEFIVQFTDKYVNFLQGC